MSPDNGKLWFIFNYTFWKIIRNRRIYVHSLGIEKKKIDNVFQLVLRDDTGIILHIMWNLQCGLISRGSNLRSQNP